MRKSNFSEGILVFDRYYTRKPNAAMLVLLRVVFCSCLSASAMLFVFSQFGFPVSLAFIGVFTAISTAVLLSLFTFLGRRFTVPAIGIIAALIIFFNFEEFWLRFSYFVDEAMLLVDGRFLFPKGYILHDIDKLSTQNALYNEGMLLGCGILCSLYSLLCAFSMKRRIRTLPALIGFIALCVPRLLSEIFEFNLWFVPVALLFAAAAAVELNYKNGLAVTHKGTAAYRSQVREEERSFNKTTNKAPLLKRIGMRASFYSKYTTSGVCCLVIFALAFMIGSGIFQEGSSIDYKELYNALFVAESSDIDPDSETPRDIVSDYFSSPDNDISTLNITNPGKGDKSIIKVSFTGDNNIYLRGDIGIDFDGTGWTTPVETTSDWLNSGISESYRPAEIHILKALVDVLGVDEYNVTEESDIQIEYLIETDVVFLPSYTNDFSFYNNENFDVFGDFVVRVSDNAGNYVSSVQCTAVSHDFTSEKYYSSDVVKMIEALYKDNNISPDELYFSVLGDDTIIGADDSVLKSYSEYVNNTYLTVPSYLESYLEDFIEENGIQGMEKDSAHSRYCVAQEINDLLSENYTYSLSGENQGEYALVQFLNESKSGHCSLYASAMTLLLRELDIPARYCTGFSIYPSKINGNTVELKERNLHAWVEVYIDELGWVTFDPTAAAVSENIIYGESEPDNVTPPKQDTTEESKESESREGIDPLPDDSNKPSHGDISNDDPTETSFEIPTYLIVIVICILTLIAVFVILIYHYSSVKRQAETVISKIDTLSIRAIYNCMIDIFYLFKLVPSRGDLPSAYYAECEKVFKAGISDNAAVLERAAFGADNASTEEIQIIAVMFRKIFANACQCSSPLRKYKIRKIVISLNTTK